MPIKLISTILVVAIVGIFCGFNMGDDFRCSINLIFYQTPKIPVFLTIIFSFVAGVLIMTPFTLKQNKKDKAPKKTEASKADAPKAEAPKTEVPKAEETPKTESTVKVDLTKKD